VKLGFVSGQSREDFAGKDVVAGREDRSVTSLAQETPLTERSVGMGTGKAEAETIPREQQILRLGEIADEISKTKNGKKIAKLRAEAAKIAEEMGIERGDSRAQETGERLTEDKMESLSKALVDENVLESRKTEVMDSKLNPIKAWITEGKNTKVWVLENGRVISIRPQGVYTDKRAFNKWSVYEGRVVDGRVDDVVSRENIASKKQASEYVSRLLVTDTRAQETANRLGTIPEWADKKTEEALKEAISGETSKVAGTSVDFPQWKNLSLDQRGDLLSRGYYGRRQDGKAENKAFAKSSNRNVA
jgi:hypothetical protein